MEVIMKSVKFWKMATGQLSLNEKMFFRDTIKTLLEWRALKEEYLELDLIMRILESEIPIASPKVTATDIKWPLNDSGVKLLPCSLDH
jgi:hypothetical protein